MHLFDARTRLLGGYGIVGGQLPLAVGAALAITYRGSDESSCARWATAPPTWRVPRVAEHRQPGDLPGSSW